MQTRLKAKLVLLTSDATWIRETELAINPFPGLGIRIEVYNIFNVDSVVVGDFGYDVTCIGHLEGEEPSKITEEKCRRLGFEIGPYP